MGISTQTLLKEQFSLKKTFNELNNRIKTIEKDLTGMRANLSAVHGALQEVEKLIQYDDNHNRGSEPSEHLTYGTTDGLSANGEAPKRGKEAPEAPVLDIKQKEEAQLLNESDK